MKSELQEQCRRLIADADAITAAWESGDLAGAVNALEGDADDARAVLAMWDAMPDHAAALAEALRKLERFATACDARMVAEGRGMNPDCEHGDVLRFARAALSAYDAARS